jgi:hypothetical protein
MLMKWIYWDITRYHKEKTLIAASKEVGLEVNAEKTMLLSRHHSHDIKIANRSFENVAQLKYLGTTVTNQILI